jgi:hypothetical protein
LLRYGPEVEIEIRLQQGRLRERRPGHASRQTHESPSSDLSGYDSTPAQLCIDPLGRRHCDTARLSEFPLRREPIARPECAGADLSHDLIGKLDVISQLHRVQNIDSTEIRSMLKFVPCTPS